MKVKKQLLWSLLLIASFILCGCGKTEVGEVSSLEITENDRISFVVKDISNTSVKVELTNESDETLYWGAAWILENKVDDVWYKVNRSEDEIIVTPDILYYLNGHESKSLEYNFSYYDVQKGNYRIVQDFSFEEGNQDEDFYVVCEFQID